jgi:hypothetical protein
MADADRTSDLRTVQVIEAETMARADGRVGVRLASIDEESQERATTVFEVNLEMISKLRLVLADAERLLRQSQHQTRN